MANNTSDDELREQLVEILHKDGASNPDYTVNTILLPLIRQREEQVAQEIQTLNAHLSYMAGQYEGITGEKSTYLLKNWPEYKHLTTTHKGDK